MAEVTDPYPDAAHRAFWQNLAEDVFEGANERLTHTPWTRFVPYSASETVWALPEGVHGHLYERYVLIDTSHNQAERDALITHVVESVEVFLQTLPVPAVAMRALVLYPVRYATDVAFDGTALHYVKIAFLLNVAHQGIAYVAPLEACFTTTNTARMRPDGKVETRSFPTGMPDGRGKDAAPSEDADEVV